jgi:DNA repair photolyase
MIGLPVFMAAKKAGRSERVRKGLAPKPNGRSADFIMAGFATGCPLACAYCYVARHRPFGNPLETYSNLDAILAATRRHWQKLPPKAPNQVDPRVWVYDVGENTDCLAGPLLPLTRRTLDSFLAETGAKPSFATKVAGGTLLPDLPADKHGRARVRASLMPEAVRRVVEAGTSPVAARLDAANAWVDRGYEVHLNFSPVIARPGWEAEYIDLFRQVDRTLSPAARRQIKAEVIFLTHHPKLHAGNARWNPAAEALLWDPDRQEAKTTHRGDDGVVRYRAFGVKDRLVATFRRLMAEHLPGCAIRYIF